MTAGEVARRLARGWNWFWFQPRGPYALAAARIVIGLAVLKTILPVDSVAGLLAVDISTAYYGYAERAPSTWQPISYLAALDVPAPTQGVLSLAFAAALFGSLLLVVGAATRVAAVATSVSALYLIAMANSWGKVDHGLHVLGLTLLVLPFARSGDAWSVDALVRRRLLRHPRPGPDWRYTWPLTAMQLGYALMFFFAGWNKLRTSGLEWAFSENMRNTLIYQNVLVRDWETASSAVRLAVDIDHTLVWWALGAGGMFTELFFIGIVFVRDRRLLRKLFLAAGAGLVIGLDVLMQLPNPVLLMLLLIFVDWNGLQARVAGLRRSRRGVDRDDEPAAAPRLATAAHA